MVSMWNVSPPPVWPQSDPENQTASEAVQCIDDATRYLDTDCRRQRLRRTFAASRIWRALPKLLSALALFALLAFGTQMLVTARHNRGECEREYYDCVAERKPVITAGAVLDQSFEAVDLAPCESLAQVESLSTGPGLACDIATSRAVLGMASWRWMLFFGLFWPTHIAALIAVKLVSLLVQGYCALLGRIGGIYTFGIERPVAHVVRASVWTGIWFTLAKKPLKWAHDAKTWNSQAKDEVWPTVFNAVHSVAWRLLVLWTLILVSRAFVKIAGRFFAVRFHYASHNLDASDEHERLLRDLASPRSVPDHAYVRLIGCGKSSRRLNGISCVWWSAITLMDTIAQTEQSHVSGRARYVCDRLCTYFSHKFGVDAEKIRSASRAQHTEAVATSEKTVCVTLCAPARNRYSPGCMHTCSDPSEDPNLNAKRMAALIFMNMQPPNASPDALSNASPKLALTHEHGLPDNAWTLMADENKMTLGGLAQRLMGVQRDCDRLHNVLYNHAMVVGEAESAIGGVLFGAIIFSGVALFNPASFVQIWTGLSVIMVALCFVFGNSARQLYESMVFLFWTRPFNVDDILHINDSKVVVTEIHLRYIRVMRDNGLNTVVPISEVTSSHIVNESRSTSIWNTVEFDADTKISIAQCEVVASHVREAISEHPDLLAGDYCVNLVPSTSNAEKIALRVSYARFPVNPHELMRDAGQTHIVDAVCGGMSAAGIKYTTHISI